MAARPVEYLPEAARELDDAVAWIAASNVRAAAKFHALVKMVEARIARNPYEGRAYVGRTRRVVLREYSYLLVYRPQRGRILIVAVAHGARKPGYWRARLSD